MSLEDETTREKRIDERIKREVKHAVANAVQPYVLKIRDLEKDIESTKERAEEERSNLAKRVQEAGKDQAREVSKQVVREFVEAIGQDPDKLNVFRRLLDDLAKVNEALSSGKKSAYAVLVTTVAGALITAVWVGIKAAVKQ